MKVVQINATCGVGSTGKICQAVSELLTTQGIENYVLYSCGTSVYPLGIKFTTDGYIRRQALKTRLLGNYGFTSSKATKRLIEELNRIKPDIVHLHNLHSHNCNLTLLFDYFRNHHTKVFWTFHDCWAFTGYCAHFVMAKCEKWKKTCNHCPKAREISWLLDRSSEMHSRKKKLSDGVDLTIITPSQWLADLVGQSCFRDCPIKVINNGIDLSVFHPTTSDFRAVYGLEGKKIILGVSFEWGYGKGLDVFINLASTLPDDYRIVLVGTNSKTDRLLPKSIVSIHRTANQQELAQIYSAADLFVNATRQDTFPTVNMEAIACGTPVLTFRTGGSPEIVDTNTGRVVECDDINSLRQAIIQICEERPFSSEKCEAAATKFSQNSRFEQYLQLYL